MGTETQEMVEEEVVQFVRADQVLCLLLDVAVLVCRDQFGADRRVDDIQQGEAGGRRPAILSPTEIFLFCAM